MNAQDIANLIAEMGFKTEVITTKFGYKFVFVTLTSRQINSMEVQIAVEAHPILCDENLTIKRVGEVVAVYVLGSKV